MGREVRKVPADWVHPMAYGKLKPLFEGAEYQSSVDFWDDECAKWKAGWRPNYCTDPEHIVMTYEQYSGQRPHRDNYMPNWPIWERTHFMMYETTSEGTPISPAFPTPEELAQWLVDNNASAFGGMTASYEGWLRAAQGGVACSMVVTGDGVMVSGVEALLK